MVYDTGVKSTEWEEGSFFNRWQWRNWTSKNEADPYLTLHTNINPQMTK